MPPLSKARQNERAWTGTERQMAHVLAAEAQGYSVENGEVKGNLDGAQPPQLTAAELELVRACNRSPSGALRRARAGHAADPFRSWVAPGALRREPLRHALELVSTIRIADRDGRSRVTTAGDRVTIDIE
jgi:hypothetical protein